MRALGPSSFASALRASAWGDDRGSATIEKIIIIACFAFAIVAGVSALRGGTMAALTCQGANLLKPGSRMCGTGQEPRGQTVASLNDVPDPAPTGPRRCTGDMCMCFVAGTPVITKTGLVPIERIRSGDLVLSQGPDGEPVWRPVLQTLVSRARSLVRLSITDGRIHEVLETTGNHPFYVAERGWIEARDLDPGRDHLLNDLGGSVDIVAADHIPGRVQVYNLEVAGLHTYFVGEIGTWVHNAGGERIRLRGTRTQLELRRPGNRVGRVVQIRIRDNNQNVYTQATVIGRNPDGTYNVRWTDGRGQVRYNQINNLGQVQGPMVLAPGAAVDIDVGGNPAVRPQGTVVAQNVNGTYDVTASNPAGVHNFTASVNGQGQLQLHPLPGERITVANIHGTQFDALVVNRMDDLSLEVELRNQTTNERLSGVLVHVGNGPPMLAELTPTPRPPAPPTTINGVPVQPPPPGVLANHVTTVGNIEIHHGAAPGNFVTNVLHDLNTIAQTPSGQALLNSLQNGGGPTARPVHIHFRPATHANAQDVAETVLVESLEGLWHPDVNEPGRGGGARVYYNPAMPLLPILPTGHANQAQVDAEYMDDLRAGFGRAVNAPPDLVLFHELIHADDYRRGLGFPPTSTFGTPSELSEERTVGLGDFAPSAITDPNLPYYSENAYRAQQ
ncbi:MAG TPA: polymorphic toxin-type HINT domain-containing protein, partial [Polyangia bacterium]